jgi:hypothetical protein
MLKKLITVATLAAILGSTACADITGPDNQKTGWCPIVGSGGTCEPGS